MGADDGLVPASGHRGRDGPFRLKAVESGVRGVGRGGIARRERLLAQTGKDRGLAGLQAELGALIAARCRGRPGVTIDAGPGYYSLTSSDRMDITIALRAEWHGRTLALVGRTPGPDGSDYKGWVLDYGFPFFLIEFTDRLRTVGLDPPQQA
jgi:hypothetical protein